MTLRRRATASAASDGHRSHQALRPCPWHPGQSNLEMTCSKLFYTIGASAPAAAAALCKVRENHGKRKRPAPYYADLLLFEGGSKRPNKNEGVYLLLPFGVGISRRGPPEAFGTRYLFVTKNIIQVISIMSRGKIGFIKIIINAMYYSYNATFSRGTRTK